VADDIGTQIDRERSRVDQMDDREIVKEMVRQMAILNLLLRTLIPTVGRVEGVVTTSAARVTTATAELKGVIAGLARRFGVGA